MIRGSSHAFPWGYWAAVFLFGGIGAAFYFANSGLAAMAGRQVMLQAVVTVTALIALGFVWPATRATLRHLRYRGLQLELIPGTAVAGEEFVGTLLVPIPFLDGREFKVELSAEQLTANRTTNSKGESSYQTISSPLHSEARNALASASGPGTLLHFAFQLPADAQASRGYAESVIWTSMTADRVYVKWHLGLKADVPGIDLDESFEIPVVRPATSEQAQQKVHVFETSPPWVGRMITLGILVGAGVLIWPWASAFYEANWGEKATTPAPVYPFSAPNTDRSAPPKAPETPATPGAPAAPSIDAPAAAPAVSPWWPRFEHAMAENSARRFTEAEKELRSILSDVEREAGVGHPFAGLLHYHLAMVHGNQRRMAERESELKRALEIFEGQPVTVVKTALGPMGWTLDREVVARDLGDFLWSQRRAAEAYGYYEKAYAAAAELETTEAVRNDRLALSAAGVMVTACTLQKWDVAEKAMGELRWRYLGASPGIQPKLKYWIDTGEPRLAARNCS